jgi:hypothetical protein
VHWLPIFPDNHYQKASRTVNSFVNINCDRSYSILSHRTWPCSSHEALWLFPSDQESLD